MIVYHVPAERLLATRAPLHTFPAIQVRSNPPVAFECTTHPFKRPFKQRECHQQFLLLLVLVCYVHLSESIVSVFQRVASRAFYKSFTLSILLRSSCLASAAGRVRPDADAGNLILTRSGIQSKNALHQSVPVPELPVARPIDYITSSAPLDRVDLATVIDQGSEERSRVETIAVAVAEQDGEVRVLGVIPNRV